MSRRDVGEAAFTLTELLVVLAMVGVLLTVLYAFGRQAQDRAELRAAAQQLVNVLNEARSQARHGSAASMVRLQGGGRYAASWGAAAVAGELPSAARVTAQGSAASSVTYSAPYGELASSVGPVWMVSSPRTGAVWYVKVVGVTGKVSLSAEP